jgi:hypothetical protein
MDSIFAQEIRFQKVAEIQPDQLLGSFITDVTVNSSGYTAVAINDLAKVHLYDREGKLMNEYGRRGKGPGDFTNLMTVELTDAIVYAMDSGPLGRIHAFDRDNPQNYQTFLIPRSPHGSPLRMWHINADHFLVEFRPSYSNLNIEDHLTSKFGLISLSNGDEIRPVFESESNEMFVDRSDGGFSVSSMPYGRKNFFIPSGDIILHNWSDEFTFTKINLTSFEKSKLQPDHQPEKKPISKEGYRKYILDELGISSDDDISRENIEDVLKSLSTDASSRLMLKTIQAKLDNRDRLHDFYPAYRWIVGDEDRICFGTYTDDLMVNKVTCMDEQGAIIGESEVSSDVELLSKKGDYMAGLRQLENGLQSVVLYRMNLSDY